MTRVRYNLMSWFLLSSPVGQVAEAIEIRCGLTKHLEVRVFADEVM